MSTQQEKFKEIADAIREKTSTTDLIKPSEFAGKVNEVYEAGKEARDNEWWKAYQTGNSENYYIAAFAGHKWTEKTFKPIRDIEPATDAQYMFYFSGIENLEEAIKKAGIKFNLGKCKSLGRVFQNFRGIIIPEIDTTSCYTSDSNLFSYSTNLTTIRKLTVKENGTQGFASWFVQCVKLANITIEGVIGQNIDLSFCPLTKESILSVITHLSDNSASKTLSLKASAVNDINWANTSIDGVTYNSFDEICDLKPNWTISLV